jgi:CheY-like chemotaxis protein
MNAFVRNEIAALVVENNPEARRMLVRALRAINASQIWEASDGFDALSTLDGTAKPVDVVVLGSAVKTHDGAEIVRRLMFRQRPPAFVFMRRAGQVSWNTAEMDVRARGLNVLGTVTTASTIADVQRVLKKLAPLKLAPPASIEASFAALPRATAAELGVTALAPAEGIDVAAFLLKVCGRCQNELLSRHGMNCVMDLDASYLAPWRCRILGGVVQAMIVGICNSALAATAKPTIAVALHHLDDAWTLSVAEHSPGDGDRPRDAAEFALARQYAKPFNGEWQTRRTGSGAVTTFRFSVDPQPKYLTPSEMLSTDEAAYFRNSVPPPKFPRFLK